MNFEAYLLMASLLFFKSYGQLENCGVFNLAWVGDGICDERIGYDGYNTPNCLFDGGDCCLESCRSSNGMLGCGDVGYSCLDPNNEGLQSISQIQYAFFVGNVSSFVSQDPRFNHALLLTLRQLLFPVASSNISLSDFLVDTRWNVINRQVALLQLSFNITTSLTNSATEESLILSLLNDSIRNQSFEKYLRLYARILQFLSLYFVNLCSISDLSNSSCQLIPFFSLPPTSLPTRLQPLTGDSNDTTLVSSALTSYNWSKYYHYPDKLPLYIIFLIALATNWSVCLLNGFARLFFIIHRAAERIVVLSLLLAGACQLFSIINLLVLYTGTGEYMVQELEFQTIPGRWMYFSYILSTLWYYPFFCFSLSLIWYITGVHHIITATCFYLLIIVISMFSIVGTFLIIDSVLSYQELYRMIGISCGSIICILQINNYMQGESSMGFKFFLGIVFSYGLTLIMSATISIDYSSSFTFFFTSFFLRIFTYLLLSFMLWNLTSTSLPNDDIHEEEEEMELNQFVTKRVSFSDNSSVIDIEENTRVLHTPKLHSPGLSSIESATPLSPSQRGGRKKRHESLFTDRVVLDLLEPVSTNGRDWSEYWLCTQYNQEEPPRSSTP